jgi:hypothetical protein
VLRAAVVLACVTGPATAAELLVLEEANWDAVAPQGKEVDCILGDLVLRNDRITAVIAQPTPGRHANMTTRNVGGAVIDLTSRDDSNDQLTAFHPGAGEFTWRRKADSNHPASGSEIVLELESPASEKHPAAELTYRLREGEPFLRIETRYFNPHPQAIEAALQDAVRMDGEFLFRFQPDARAFTAQDSWWRQAYGLRVEQAAPSGVGDSVNKKRPLLSYQSGGAAQTTLAPQQTLVLNRELFPAANALELHGLMAESRGEAGAWVDITVRDALGPVPLARVELLRDAQPTADQGELRHGRTNPQGQVRLRVPAGEHPLRIRANGRPEYRGAVSIGGDLRTRQVEVQLQLPGYVDARITDDQGRAIPCKVEFRGTAGTPSPDFGPDTFDEALRNLVYTANGTFRQEIAPGRYEVIISHGPEYDAVFTTVEVRQGEPTSLSASLKHSVETPGWISSDFHSHSTPSGDNTSSQRGRVLNLLAEHVEFAPCTEHNRISTYIPHLLELQATDRMATCSGIEVTGNQLPVNHQNAFPLVHKPRTQDGGGPDSNDNPVVQIERLALWDQRAAKVVQANHPNLMQILGDRDLDGQADGGFERMFSSMDVIEVHPPAGILQYPTTLVPAEAEANPIFHWLRLLNLGYRIPGVVNTDAHYNFHGSGFLRNYLKSPTDEPARVLTTDMVRSAEAGHMIMTNGPYLEVQASSDVAGERRTAIAGDDLVVGRDLELQVRVQSANWLDVNRVFVLLNGRPVTDLDFRRATHADRFQSGVVKFDQRLPVTTPTDAHLIVVAVGEGLKLGPVVGPDHENDLPIAVSNPIFLDISGDGFQPNGDPLDIPLPIAK